MDGSCVLVGTDFSPGAAAALAEARHLATRMGCALRVVHVVEAARASGWQPSAEARQWLTRAQLDEDALDVRFGRAWIELARCADSCTPAFVVVGSHGSSGYQPVSVGATAERLSLNARHPVLLVGPRRSGAHRLARATRE
jgi:nucleotide-binding universal stress UspA family protein